MKTIRFSLVAREMLAAASADFGRRLGGKVKPLEDGRFEADIEDDVYEGLAKVAAFDASEAIVAAVLQHRGDRDTPSA